MRISKKSADKKRKTWNLALLVPFSLSVLDAAFLLTVGSFLLTVEHVYSQLSLGAFLLRVRAFLLTIGALLLTMEQRF